MDTVQKILATLGIPENAQRVYLALLKTGETTPRLLAQQLPMSRPSIYDQIKILEQLGLIFVRDLDNKTYVAPGDIEILSRKLKEKRLEIEAEEKAFTEIQKLLTLKTTTKVPRIKFFAGKEALREALHDTLWSTKSDMVALWPYTSMLSMFGEDFLQTFNEKRIRQQITLRTLWTGKGKSAHIWEENDTGILRRHLPHLSLDMGYIIYGDKVLCISSTKESFGFCITSTAFATMQRVHFESLWETAHKD